MKRFFIIVMAFVLAFSPNFALADTHKKGDGDPDIVNIQRRLKDLGYLNFRPTGKYGDMTVNAVSSFQSTNSLPVTGVVDKDTYSAIFSFTAKRRAMNPNFVRVSGLPLMATPIEYGDTTEWAQANTIFPVGADAEIIDFNTRKKFKVKRTGGVNHAHIEPLTADDAYAFKSSFGGDYTWEKRSVLVKVNGHTLAASLFGNPNGMETISNNNLDGSLCLYFIASTSEFGGIMDAEHTSKILAAANS